MDIGDAVRPGPTARAGEKLDAEHSLQEFDPGDPGSGNEAGAGPHTAGTAGGVQTFPLGNDVGTPAGVRGKDPMVVDGVAARWRDLFVPLTMLAITLLAVSILLVRQSRARNRRYR